MYLIPWYRSTNLGLNPSVPIECLGQGNREQIVQTCHSYWFYQYVQIFYPLNLAKYWFSSLKFGKIQIFSGMRKGFFYIFFSHTDFPPKIQIFLILYTDFVLDQSGRSDCLVYMLGGEESIWWMMSIPHIAGPLTQTAGLTLSRRLKILSIFFSWTRQCMKKLCFPWRLLFLIYFFFFLFLVTRLEEIFYKMSVDFVVQGHEHNYERLWPVYKSQVTNYSYINPSAPVQLISGAAGSQEQADHFSTGTKRKSKPPLWPENQGHDKSIDLYSVSICRTLKTHFETCFVFHNV